MSKLSVEDEEEKAETDEFTQCVSRERERETIIQKAKTESLYIHRKGCTLRRSSKKIKSKRKSIKTHQTVRTKGRVDDGIGWWWNDHVRAVMRSMADGWGFLYTAVQLTLHWQDKWEDQGRWR